MVVPRVYYCILREESECLLSTIRRLVWCDRTDAQGGVNSPRSSGFRVASRSISSTLSYLQVLMMDPCSVGYPTEQIVMGPDDRDGSKYIPR
jgi:hypothetical protein